MFANVSFLAVIRAASPARKLVSLPTGLAAQSRKGRCRSGVAVRKQNERFRTNGRQYRAIPHPTPSLEEP